MVLLQMYTMSKCNCIYNLNKLVDIICSINIKKNINGDEILYEKSYFRLWQQLVGNYISIPKWDIPNICMF